MIEVARESRIRFSVFELDTSTGELRKAGTRIKLQEQPFRVLLALLEQPGQVVTRDQLKHRIWPDDSFGDFDHAVNVAVAKLRVALSDSAEVPRFVETLSRRGYRFIFPLSPPPHSSPASIPNLVGTVPRPGAGPRFASRRLVSVLLLLTVTLAGVVLWFLSRKPRPLTDRDSIVLAGFTNTTGDTVFDGTLLQGLSVQLEQSPFLRIVSEYKIRETLLLMGQKADAQLTPQLALDLCRRAGSAALLNGSISRLGSQYVVGLQALDCRSGDSLADEQVTASDKDQVLKALATAALRIRTRLGESLGTIEKFNAPIEQVTTPSLEALQAYTLGRAMINDSEHDAARTYLQHAVQLDPNFAMAYASLGTARDSDPGAAQSIRKAYSLRDRVSERERFYIDAHFDENVSGNLEKARRTYELWARTYPRDDIPPSNLILIYSSLRQDDLALSQAKDAARLFPTDRIDAALLVASYLHVNQLDNAKIAVQQALSANLDSYHLRFLQYQMAFLRSDTQTMAQALDSAMGKPELEDDLLQSASATALHSGRLRLSRELSSRSISSALRADHPEAAAKYHVCAAFREALLGSPAQARLHLDALRKLSDSRDVRYGAALTYSLLRDTTRAQSLADALAKDFPEDTLVRYNYLPVLRARLALLRGDAPKAIAALQDAAPFGDMHGVIDPLYPAYVRGESYLLNRNGASAAPEFQNVLAHPGIVLNSITGTLSRLALARSYALQGDSLKARAAYNDFFVLWKEADPDLPLLRQARSEFAALP